MSGVFNKALLLEHLKRFWALSVLVILAYIVWVFIPLTGTGGNEWNFHRVRTLGGIISFDNINMLLIMVLTPVVAAFCVFGCFFGKTAATFNYSLPLNKKQFFATNALAGIILSLIPVLVFCAILLYPMGFHEAAANYSYETDMKDWHYYVLSPQRSLSSALLPNGAAEGAAMNSFPIIAGLFLRMALTTVFYFAVSWLAFSLAGHGFIAVLIVSVLPFFPMMLISLVDGMLQFYAFRYVSPLSNSFFDKFMVYHNPALWGLLIRYGRYSRVEAVILPFVSNVTVGACLYAAAYKISCIRKPENTGNSVMFRDVKNVLVFLVALAVMIIGGMIFYATDYSVFMLHIGFIIGFPVGYLIAQMIAEKSFNVFDKIKYLPYFAGIAVMIYGLMLFVTRVVM